MYDELSVVRRHYFPRNNTNKASFIRINYYNTSAFWMTCHDNYEKKDDQSFVGDETQLLQLPMPMKPNETRIEGPRVSSGDPVRHPTVTCASSTHVPAITSEQPVAPERSPRLPPGAAPGKKPTQVNRRGPCGGGGEVGPSSILAPPCAPRLRRRILPCLQPCRTR